MSRVGKKLIPLPKGVKITVGDQLTVEGPKGKQTVPVPKGITFSEKDGVLTVIARWRRQSRAARADARADRQRDPGCFDRIHARAGHCRHRLPLRGEGPDRDLHAGLFAFDRVLSAGWGRHEGRQAGEQLTPLVLTGSDKQVVGQVAAKMRALRPPDPYKNKGVRYSGEALRKKVGKTGASGGK